MKKVLFGWELNCLNGLGMEFNSKGKRKNFTLFDCVWIKGLGREDRVGKKKVKEKLRKRVSFYSLVFLSVSRPSKISLQIPDPNMVLESILHRNFAIHDTINEVY